MAAGTRSFHEHFKEPGRIGRLPDAELTSEAENQVCGDWVRFHLQCEGGVIQAASVQVRGCSATIACASLAAEAVEGLDIGTARALDVARLAELAGARPRDLSHAPAVVARALSATLGAD
jgi:NifU-like protein involved in Fe-S cluster formation